jgi:hypothetical protein
MLIILVLLASLGAACGFCAGKGAFFAWQWLWMLPVSFLVSLVVFTLLALAFFLVASLVIDTRKSQDKDSKFYRRLVEVYLVALRTVLRIRIHVSPGLLSVSRGIIISSADSLFFCPVLSSFRKTPPLLFFFSVVRSVLSAPD